MFIVHEVPRRIRLRAKSPFDARLRSEFMARLSETIQGVSQARANPAARSLIVEYDGRTDTRVALLREILDTRPALRPRPLAAEPANRYLVRTLVSASVFAANFLLPWPVRAVLTSAIALPALLKGVGSFMTKGLCVEILDAAALTIAMARRDFGTVSATLTLLNLGNYLEETTTQSSNDLLTKILARGPTRAWLESGDGSVLEVPENRLRENDIIVVGPGDMIPVDGQVVSGSATVNLSSITGESVPVDREAGAQVLAGGVVEEGRVRVRAVRVGNATTTARITAFIETALERKPLIQSSAERLAAKRILFTLGLGALTFALTRDVNRLASVFLVDYSCALKLGAPVAIKSALYRGAKAGFLIKGGQGIEALASVDTMVFDKTGTLTFGMLKVSDVVPLNDCCSDEHLLALLASLEEHATHPVADAIVREARRHDLEHIHHDAVDFIVAHGLASEVRGQRVVVGSRHFLEAHEEIAFSPFESITERLEGEGKLLLYAALDGKPAGIVGLMDQPRPEAADAMTQLRELGIGSLVMLTGDRKQKAQALADELGLDLTFAERQPEEKAEIVQELQGKGRTVAFVGDGVNDGPALIAADVGIAMPRGADLARATADVVVLRDEITGIVEARALAADTIHLIQSNFRWAVALNTVFFIAAAAGRTSPVFSAIAHNGVTIATLIRALMGPRRSLRRNSN